MKQEVAFWLKHRNAQKLLIVLTDGDMAWDTEAGDFHWGMTTALPKNLAKAFTEEPLYLDFRWAKTSEGLSLDNSAFLDGVATVAATLHGRSKRAYPVKTETHYI